jgi:hypothetical protein
MLLEPQELCIQLTWGYGLDASGDDTVDGVVVLIKPPARTYDTSSSSQRGVPMDAIVISKRCANERHVIGKDGILS